MNKDKKRRTRVETDERFYVREEDCKNNPNNPNNRNCLFLWVSVCSNNLDGKQQLLSVGTEISVIVAIIKVVKHQFGFISQHQLTQPFLLLAASMCKKEKK